MNVGEVCTRKVVTVSMDDGVVRAAQLMRDHHVGDVVVVDEEQGRVRPVGMLTDRDIVVGAVAAAAGDLESMLVRELILGDLITIGEGEGLFEAAGVMREAGVRRLPVIDKEGALVGVIAMDDLLEILADELSQMVQLMRGQRRHEADHWSAS